MEGEGLPYPRLRLEEIFLEKSNFVFLFFLNPIESSEFLLLDETFLLRVFVSNFRFVEVLIVANELILFGR